MTSYETRKIWLRERERLLGSEEVLMQHLNEVSVRMIVLPEEVMSRYLDFDEEFLKWWAEERNDPVTGRTVRWGFYQFPSSEAVISVPRPKGEASGRYIALSRNGSLDVALGRDVSRTLVHGEDETRRRHFKLITMLGRIWFGLDFYSEAVEKFAIKGPWELSMQVRDAAGSHLSNLGEGWRDPASDDFSWETPICLEETLALRREFESWPTNGAELQELIFSIGSWLENSWGTTHRRFLANRGDLEGEFDRTKFRWD